MELKSGECLKQIARSARKTDDKFAFQNIYKNNIADKAHIRYLKYIY